MSKPLKCLSLIVGTLLLTIFLALMADTAADAFLPAPLAQLKALPKLANPLRPWLASYLFWIALVLAVLVFLAMVLIAFWPRTRTEIALGDKAGQLDLKKSAIDGLVKSAIESHGYMRNPKVTTKLYKRKFKIKVKGEIIPRQDALARAEQIRQEIERQLKEFLGLDRTVHFKVEVTQAAEATSQTRSRVE